MSGKCYGCAVSFGLFKKEHGCKNCGFSFCSNCLPEKIAVPKRKNEVLPVCSKCFAILSGKKTEEDFRPIKFSPPENYKKRMEALAKREEQQNTASGATGGATGGAPGISRQKQRSKKYKGMSQKDIEIAQRLEKLKESSKQPPPPSVEEMEARLAKLKGTDAPAAASGGGAPVQPFYQPPDTRTQQEQMTELLDEICNEVEIDSHYPSPQQEVSDRLAQLKATGGQPASTAGTTSTTDEQNNLNKPTDKSQSYTKNIGTGTGMGEISLEEMNALITASAKELEIDAERALVGLQKDKELMERLNQLKVDRKKREAESGATPKPLNTDVGDDDEDSDEEALKIVVKKAIEESLLDEEVTTSGYGEVVAAAASRRSIGGAAQQPEVDSDELPWCCICNEDASLRCQDCDNDLYCNRCFKEGHGRFEMKEHKTTSYKPPAAKER